MKQQSKVKIAKWKNNASAALTLSFDDGYKDTFKSCIHHLAQHKIKATWNIPTAYIDGILEGRDVVSWSDINEIARQLGIEIASHSVNHLDSHTSPLVYLRKILIGFYHARNKVAYLQQIITMASELLTDKQETVYNKKGTEPNIEHEVTVSKNEIDKQVVPHNVSSYVYPHGKCNRRYKDLVKSAGYVCARSTLRGYNTYKKVDFFDLRCMVWNRYTTVKEADSWICEAMKKEAWLIETYHLVSESNPSAYDFFTPTETFRQHIEYISNLAKNNKIWVDTQQDIARYMKQRLGSEVTVIKQDSNSYTLRLNTTQPQLSDQELTLRVEIPHQWHEIKVSQGGSPIATQKEGNFILFNALPSKESIFIESTR